MAEPFKKIVVANPVVELDGDEMTRIIWKKIREEVRTYLNNPLTSRSSSHHELFHSSSYLFSK